MWLLWLQNLFYMNNWKFNGQNYGFTTEFCKITLFPWIRLNPSYKIGCLWVSVSSTDEIFYSSTSKIDWCIGLMTKSTPQEQIPKKKIYRLSIGAILKWIVITAFISRSPRSSLNVVADFFDFPYVFLINSYCTKMSLTVLAKSKSYFSIKELYLKGFVHHRQELEQIDLWERLQPWMVKVVWSVSPSVRLDWIYLFPKLRGFQSRKMKN